MSLSPQKIAAHPATILLILLLLFLAASPSRADKTPDKSPHKSPGETTYKSYRDNDANILLTGRWNDANPQAPWCSWLGCSIIANFSGSEIRASFETVADKNDSLFVILDNDLSKAKTIQLGQGKREYVLASHLSDGVHKIEIVKKSPGGSAHILTFHGFKITGMGLTPPPARPRYKIEFYGDSNLAGISVEHERNRGETKFRDSFYGLAGIASRMLNAEYHNISQGGETIHDAPKNIWDKFYPNSPEKWDFKKNSPDVVVINLGANDVKRPLDSIKRAFHSFLDTVRATHPRAHIVLMNSFGWSYDEPANFTSELIQSRNDPSLTCLHFPWVFEQWHGCQYDHSGMAHLLAKHLSAELNWKLNPSDVMNGFGIKGDVANGSFEQSAPFGGFGWRYLDDPGVERIDNESTAKHGNYYVSLKNGAKIHQPNPASNGEHFQITGWLRGNSKNKTAVVSVEFKDQKMWTQPLDVQTDSHKLTPGWKKFVMRVRAPEKTVRPIFQIKLIFSSSEGSVVEVDHVTMSKIDQ